LSHGDYSRVMAAFQESTAGTVTIVAGLESTFADELGALTVPWQGAAAPDPQLLVLNEQLAASLRLDVAALRSVDGIGVLSGSTPAISAIPVCGSTGCHSKPRSACSSWRRVAW